jgi:hypothetical protein
MLNDDVFIFDNVVQMCDPPEDNLVNEASIIDRNGQLKRAGKRRCTPKTLPPAPNSTGFRAPHHTSPPRPLRAVEGWLRSPLRRHATR